MEGWSRIQHQTRSGSDRIIGNKSSEQSSEALRMETFAEKVKSGGGTRFDPLLEEKGGWISGEAPGQDEEMVDAVLGAMAEASNQVAKDGLNPFRAQSGEILPTNLERNVNGFLIRKDAILFTIDSQKLLKRITLLKEQLVIGKFVGPKPNAQGMEMWIQNLNREVGGVSILFCRDVGKGYFFLACKESVVIQKVLMLSLDKSKWGTCMIQSWVPGFNPESPSNLAFPTWVTLRNLPYEHLDQALEIAKSLGEVIGTNKSNVGAKDQRFCINLKVKDGWSPILR